MYGLIRSVYYCGRLGRYIGVGCGLWPGIASLTHNSHNSSSRGSHRRTGRIVLLFTNKNVVWYCYCCVILLYVEVCRDAGTNSSST